MLFAKTGLYPLAGAARFEISLCVAWNCPLISNEIITCVLYLFKSMAANLFVKTVGYVIFGR